MQKIIKNKIIDKSYFKNIFKNIKNILRTFFQVLDILFVLENNKFYKPLL